MFSPDQDYKNSSYQLLIRARTQAQFEKAILAIVSRIAATAASPSASEKLTPSIAQAVSSITLRTSGEGRAPSASNVVSALRILADFDDWWCGTPPRPWPWPWWTESSKPSPDPWGNFGYLDMAALKAITNLAKLVTPEVGKDLAETSQSMMDNYTASRLISS